MTRNKLRFMKIIGKYTLLGLYQDGDDLYFFGGLSLCIAREAGNFLREKGITRVDLIKVLATIGNKVPGVKSEFTYIIKRDWGR